LPPLGRRRIELNEPMPDIEVRGANLRESMRGIGWWVLSVPSAVADGCDFRPLTSNL